MEQDATIAAINLIISLATIVVVSAVVIYYYDIKKLFGRKLTAERARRMADKKTRIKEDEEFEKVLGEILWLSREVGRRQLKHVELNERYVEALRQLGYEVEEESEPNTITGVRGYRIKW